MNPIFRYAASGLSLSMILLAATTSGQAQETSRGPISRFVQRIRERHSQADPVQLAVVEQAQSIQWVALPQQIKEEPPAEEAPALDVQQDAETEAREPEGYQYAQGCDPYGFMGILNQFRASAGLHPLAYDENLSAWASQNNAAQCSRGLGHHVNPNAFQNCGWNYADASSVAQGWMESPGHRENMLAPSVTRFGIAFGPGPYWTLNAR
jgi:uncharacterized protein YkwD